MRLSSTAVPAPAPAATLLLVRDAPAFQVLMVERHASSRFGPGALVFPGGRLDAQDADPAWRDALGADGVDEEQLALRVCAVRETFEETSILLARSSRDHEPARLDLAKAREQAETFRTLLEPLGLRPDLGALSPFARWITPRGYPARYDATFFIACAPEGQEAISDGVETVAAEWIEPSRALRLGERRERRLMYPTRVNLEMLRESGDVAEAIGKARSRPIVAFEPVLDGIRPGDFLGPITPG